MMIIFKVGHSHDDVAEVNGFDLQMLPGFFLYGKEPGYKANEEVVKTLLWCHFCLVWLVIRKVFITFSTPKGKKNKPKITLK